MPNGHVRRFLASPLNWAGQVSRMSRRKVFVLGLVTVSIALCFLSLYLTAERIIDLCACNKENSCSSFNPNQMASSVFSASRDRKAENHERLKLTNEVNSFPYHPGANFTGPSTYDDVIKRVSEKLARQDKESKVALVDFLASEGTDESIAELKFIIEYDTDPDIRANAISSLKWDDDPDMLMALLTTEKDPTTIEAVIVAADLALFDEQTREKFNQHILDSLFAQDDSEVIKSILSYFGDKDPNWILQAYTALVVRHDLPEDVLEYMRIIAEDEPYLKSLLPPLTVQTGDLGRNPSMEPT